jgi:hypothetical protein
MEQNFTGLVYHWLNSMLGGPEQEHTAMFDEVDDTRMMRDTMLRYFYQETAPDPDILSGYVYEAIAAMPTSICDTFVRWVGCSYWELGQAVLQLHCPSNNATPSGEVDCYEYYNNRIEHDIKYVSDSDGSLKILENLGP